MAKKLREEVLARASGLCIYCGGSARATTIDHKPPIALFSLRDRPKGLEFPSCTECNNGAGLADLACALISRVFPDPPQGPEAEEITSLFQSVANNIPGLLEEMLVPEAEQRRRLHRLGLNPSLGLLNLAGPIAMAHLNAFGARLGFAMHFQATGLIVPPEGGVLVRIFSNVDNLEGRIPQEIFELLPEPGTLTAGKKTVAQQFSYAVRATDNLQMSASFASFRHSFAIVTTTALDVSKLAWDSLPAHVSPIRPGQLRAVAQPTYSLGARFIL